jgi:hypothetical protein
MSPVVPRYYGRFNNCCPAITNDRLVKHQAIYLQQNLLKHHVFQSSHYWEHAVRDLHFRGLESATQRTITDRNGGCRESTEEKISGCGIAVVLHQDVCRGYIPFGEWRGIRCRASPSPSETTVARTRRRPLRHSGQYSHHKRTQGKRGTGPW